MLRTILRRRSISVGEHQSIEILKESRSNGITNLDE